ncbi:MAG: dihydrodipicolinate reductase [Armatimonadota bacterium]
MTEAIRTVHIGLGPIGCEIIRAGTAAGLCEPVAAADISPDIVGCALCDVVGRGELPGFAVCGELEAALDAAVETGAEAAVVCTGSRVEAIEEQFAAVLSRGLCCISTCEELVFPWLRAATSADRLDGIAVENDAVLVGAGVNPGFVLDLLPFVLSRVCEQVRSVHAGRFVDASRRRPQLQAKIGSGMDAEDFRALAAEGRIGHVGLTESAALLADSLGWPWDEFEETIEPVIAHEPISSEHFRVAAGQVRGQAQTVRMGAVTLELVIALGEQDRDVVRIDGEPPVHALIEGGIHGDTATAGTVINLLRPMLCAQPGLRTVTELALG